MKILATIRCGDKEIPGIFELIEEDGTGPLLLFNSHPDESKWAVFRLNQNEIVDLDEPPAEKEYVGELDLIRDVRSFQSLSN